MTPFGTHRNDPVLTGIADQNDHGGSASADCTAVAYCSASTASLAAEVQPVRRRVRVRPRRKLPDGDDDLAFGVPVAEIAQRLGHLAERKAAVDDRGDLSRLDELDEGSRCWLPSRTASSRMLLRPARPSTGPIVRTCRSVATDPPAYR